MALVKSKIKDELKKAYSDALYRFIEIMKQSSGNPDQLPVAIAAAADIFSTTTSDSIDAYIKSAIITIPAGTKVAVDPFTTAAAANTATGTAATGTAAASTTTGITTTDVTNLIKSTTYKGATIEITVPATIS